MKAAALTGKTFMELNVTVTHVTVEEATASLWTKGLFLQFKCTYIQKITFDNICIDFGHGFITNTPHISSPLTSTHLINATSYTVSFIFDHVQVKI